MGIEVSFFVGKSVDGASKHAGDEEFDLGVGEEAALGARVLEAGDVLLGQRDYTCGVATPTFQKRKKSSSGAT
jgi:hypothetical protein